MSTHFNGYVFRQADLWHITGTLRSYLAATHPYALTAQIINIATYHRIVHTGDQHRQTCAVNYLGQCTCNFWHDLNVIRDYITNKQRDANGLEAQCVEYGNNYIMRIIGDYRWMPELPDALLDYLQMERVFYSDSSDVPPEMRRLRRFVDHFDREMSENRYFTVPLLTIHDVDQIMWDMAAFLGRRAWAKRKELEEVA